MTQIEQAKAVIFIGNQEPTIAEIQARAAKFTIALEKVSIVSQSLGVADNPTPEKPTISNDFFIEHNVNNFGSRNLSPQEQLEYILEIENFRDKPISKTIAILAAHQQQLQNYLTLRQSQDLLRQVEAHPTRDLINPAVITYARSVVANLQSAAIQLPEIKQRIIPEPKFPVTELQPKRQLDLAALPHTKGFVDRASVKEKALLKSVMLSESAYEIAEIIRNFATTDEQLVNDFIGNLFGRVFADIAFKYLECHPKSTGLVILSPEQTQSFFRELHPGYEELNDFGLNYGIRGVRVPDTISLQIADDAISIVGINEFKCVNGTTYDHQLSIETQAKQFRSPNMEGHLRISGAEPLDPVLIGVALNMANPAIAVNAVSLAPDYNLTYLVPKDSSLSIDGVKIEELPLSTTQLKHLLIALAKDLTGENSLLVKALAKKKSEPRTIAPPPALPNVAITTSTVFERSIKILKLQTGEASPIGKEITLDQANKEINQIIPNLEEHIKEEWDNIIRRLMGISEESVPLEIARKLFPEIDHPDSQFKFPRIDDPKKPPNSPVSLAELVNAFVINKYGAKLSAKAREVLTNKILTSKRPPAA